MEIRIRILAMAYHGFQCLHPYPFVIKLSSTAQKVETSVCECSVCGNEKHATEALGQTIYVQELQT